MKKHLAGMVALAAAASMVAGLSACSTPADDGTTELSFMMWGDGGDAQKAYEDLIASFEAENPDITVNAEFVPTSDYDTVLKTRLSGGAGPDVFGLDLKNTAAFLRDGFLTDLSQADFYDDLTESAQADSIRGNGGGSEAYSVPISQSGNGIIYNLDLFEQAGIEEPTTYSELVEAAKALKASGSTPFAMSGQDNWWLQFITYYAVAEHVFDENPDFNEELVEGKSSYADSGWRRALEIVQELTPYYMENPLGTSSAAAQAAFLSGTAAMYPATWILPEARAANMNVGYMNFPTTEEADAPGIWGSYGVSMGVNSGNGKSEAAIQFLDYFFEDDVYVDYLTVLATFPVKEGVVLGDIDPLYPDMQASWEGKTFHAHLLPDDPAIQEALLPELQNLVGGMTDVDTVLAKLDVAADEVRENLQ